MPKVAQYEGNQVLTEVVGQPRASAAAGNALFNANINAAQGLNSLAQAGLNLKQRIDTTTAEEKLVEFERAKNDLFFNPESGYFNTQGRNAFDSATPTNEALIKLKKQFGEKLTGNAKMMFDKSADAHITRAQADIMRHSSKGLQAWEVATINAQVENTLESASLYWNQPDKLSVQNALGRQAIIDAAEIEGIGAEATNERLQTFDSSFSKTTILSAINSSAAEGTAAMDKYGDMLEGPDKVKLEKEIKAKTEAEKIQSDAQKAVITSGRLVESYDTREEILDEVNKIEDPELRKKTMTESMHQFNLKKQAEAEAQTDAFKQAEAHLIDEGGSAETYQVGYPEQWQKLSKEQQRIIEAGRPVTTNWVKYSELMTLPQDELAKVDITKHLHELESSHREKLMSAIKTAQGKGSSSDKAQHQVGRTRTAQTTDALVQLLGKKNLWNNTKREQADMFYNLLDSEVAFREEQKGSSLSSTEFTQLLSELTGEVTIKRTALGFDFLAPDAKTDITKMLPEDVDALSKYLRDNGVPVTADNLAKAHRMASK